MFDVGMQDLFDAIHGRARSMSPQREDAHAEQNATINEKAAPQTLSTPTPPPALEPVPSELEDENRNEQSEDEIRQTDTAPFLAAKGVSPHNKFPIHLDFLPPSSKFAYTTNNPPLHGYGHALTGLLTQLNAAGSFGDGEVRKARKEAVKSIGLELDKPDELRTEAWEGQSAGESAVADSDVELECANGQTAASGFETEVDKEAAEKDKDEL